MDIPLVYGFNLFFTRFMDQAGVPSLSAPQESDARHFPPLQIFEDDNALCVRAGVSGISLENLHVTLESGTLSLEGVAPFLPGRHLRRERPSGPFTRDIRLPFPVDADAVQAVIRNGILTVTLPKTPLEGKRAIPIHGKNPGPP